MQKISECEEQIMVIIWKDKNAKNLKEIIVDANSAYKHDWKPQTVSTFLHRLVKKGYLAIHRENRYGFYLPLIDKETYRREKIKELVDLLYDSDVEAAKTDIG